MLGGRVRAIEDVPGLCKSSKLKEIGSHNYILTPGRYVGAADMEDDDMPFSERFAALRANLAEQFKESRDLEAAITERLARFGV
jgi:type I restriction enzyme M protein